MKSNYRTIILLGCFLVSTYFIGAEMRKFVNSSDVISFEFLWTEKKAQTLLSQPSWNLLDTNGHTKIERLRQNTYLDFLYLVSYCCLFLFLTRSLLGNRTEIISRLYKVFIVAALVDVIENLCLLQVLSGSLFPYTFIMSACASLKFGLLFIGLGGLIVSLVKIFLLKRR